MKLSPDDIDKIKTKMTEKRTDKCPKCQSTSISIDEQLMMVNQGRTPLILTSCMVCNHIEWYDAKTIVPELVLIDNN